MDEESGQKHIEKLRGWRNGRKRDLTLSYLADHVNRKIAKPHSQLDRIIKLWELEVPAHMADRTAMASLKNGLLTVHVADGATLYELDRLLRDGLDKKIKTQCGAAVRRIKTKIAKV